MVAHALGAHVGEPGRRRDDAGVGDDRGEGPERLRRGVEHADRVGFDRHVALERDGAAALLGDDLDDRVRRLGVFAIVRRRPTSHCRPPSSAQARPMPREPPVMRRILSGI